MKVKEFITMLLDFNMEADIFVGDNIDNVPELSWEADDDNNLSIEEGKRKTKSVGIDYSFSNNYEIH